jgi:hypothetical protein
MANTLSSRVDATQLHMVSRADAATVAHELLHGGSHHKPELLAAGGAVLFAVIAERSGMDPHDLFLLGNRILHASEPHHFKQNVQMEALRDFAGLRLRNNPII